MADLVCGTSCADLHWNYVGLHLQGAGIMWLGLFGVGAGVSLTSVTSNTDNLRDRFESICISLQNSQVFLLLTFLFGIAQVAIFCVRTYTKSVDIVTYIVEAVACLLFLAARLPAWVLAHLKGPTAGMSFMLGRIILDCMLVSSVACIPIVALDEQKSWSCLSFLAAVHVLEAWRYLINTLNLDMEVLRWQLLDVLVSTAIIIIFTAMTMLTLENLGDPPQLVDFNKPKWNTISAIYFVFLTVATVGYGDLAPKTGLGRLFSLIALFGGMCALILALHKVLVAISLNRSGGGSFSPLGRVRHIIIVGAPASHMIKNFIEEMLHPDHAEDAEDLHIVFLFSTPALGDAVNRYLRHRADIQVSQRVHVLMGSCLDRSDLLRASAPEAAAFFVLPNVMCKDPLQEDTENIIRMVAIQRYIPTVRVIIMLMKQDHKQLLNEAGTGLNITVLSFDQFKLEIAGKSCEVPGFGTFVCNLCKSISEEEETQGFASKAPWQQDYDRGSANELYEVELSSQYARRNATFSEVVLDVLEHTGGFVYLIGLVEFTNDAKRILINPGPTYAVRPQTQSVVVNGIFIAPDRESIIQCEGGMVFLGRRERPPAPEEEQELEGGTKGALRALVFNEVKEELDKRVLASMTPEQQQRTKHMVSLIKQHRRANQPARPPLKMLARGGHIVVMCVGAKGVEDLRLGLHHFVRPLRQHGDDVDNVPIVVLAPQIPKDWFNVGCYHEVYLLKGSPLSLFDMQRANFEHASHIFICHVGCGRPVADLVESWMVDSEIICCARLVESHLPPDSAAMVVVELSNDLSHPFVPLRRSVTHAGASRISSHGDLILREEVLGSEGTAIPANRRMSLRRAGTASTNTSGTNNTSAGGAATAEYYQQIRYASGQMFVGTVVTSLVANTFYSPSLCDLAHTMIASQIEMVEVPPDWVGKTFAEYFDHLLWYKQLLSVGIYRSTSSDAHAHTFDVAMQRTSVGAAAARPKRPRLGFIFTSPPGKDTIMMPNDRVICFGAAETD